MKVELKNELGQKKKLVGWKNKALIENVVG